MPRVYFDKEIRAKSGRYKGSDIVFKAARNRTIGLTRTHVKKTRTTDHQLLKGSKLKAASALWHEISASFKADLERYAHAFNSQHLPEDKLYLSAFNIFIKAVCRYSTPIDDLSVLVMIFGNSLNSWIDNGFLRRVTVSSPFNAVVMS